MAENWFVRSPEGDRGPFGFAEVLGLIRSGLLGADDEIKCSLDGQWIKVNRIDLDATEGSGKVKALTKATQPIRRMSSAAATKPKADPFTALVEMISDRMSPRIVWPVVLIAVWILINYIVLRSINPYETEREYLDQFVAIGDELARFRDTKDQAQGWEKFAGQSHQIVARIVDDLQKTAAAEHPMRRHLLWAGKNCLLPGLDGPEAFTPELQERFDMHIRQAQLALGGDAHRL